MFNKRCFPVGYNQRIFFLNFVQATTEVNNDHDVDAAAVPAAHILDAEAAVNHDDASETETVHDADDDERQAANDTRLIQKTLTILQDQIDFPVRIGIRNKKSKKHYDAFRSL